MVTKYKTCIHPDCKKRPNFGLIDDKNPTYCVTHKLFGMVNILDKSCIYPDCKKIPSFGLITDKKATYCSVHKLSGMVDIRNKSCIYPSCKKLPSFGLITDKKATYCAEHKLSEMINIQGKMCIHQGCKKRPVFGLITDKKAVYCSTHKLDGMINVKNKTCIHPGCKKIPVFGLITDRKAVYCSTHKLSGMTNVKDKTCIHPDCKKLPSYGLITDKKATYCGEHKLLNMINIKSKTCVYPDCKKIPSFGQIGDKKATYCVEHKKSEMVRIGNNKCANLNCTKQPWYGFIGYTPTKCAGHKDPGMIANPIKRCKCNEKAVFSNGSDYFCEAHKPDMSHEFIDTCDVCCQKVEKGKTRCDICVKAVLTKKSPTLERKEIRIKKMLETEGFDMIHDQVIDNSCYNRRPDFRLKGLYNEVIIEVDEFQHARNNYNCECEITRMKQIYFSAGAPTMTFIRFNPDKYKTLDGSAGLASIKRYNILTRLIRQEVELTAGNIYNGIKVYYLCYDGFLESCISYDIINPYEIK